MDSHSRGNAALVRQPTLRPTAGAAAIAETWKQVCMSYRYLHLALNEEVKASHLSITFALRSKASGSARFQALFCCGVTSRELLDGHACNMILFMTYSKLCIGM